MCEGIKQTLIFEKESNEMMDYSLKKKTEIEKVVCIVECQGEESKKNIRSYETARFNV